MKNRRLSLHAIELHMRRIDQRHPFNNCGSVVLLNNLMFRQWETRPYSALSLRSSTVRDASERTNERTNSLLTIQYTAPCSPYNGGARTNRWHRNSFNLA